MKQLLSIIFLTMFIAFCANAQTAITGVVKTSQGRGVDMASVVVSPANAPKQFLASTFTEEDGGYTLNVTSNCDSLLLKASSIEIAPTTIKIPNRSGKCDIIVEDKAVELKEVVVKSKKIYSHGDTINYNVANFLGQNDDVRYMVDTFKCAIVSSGVATPR